MLEQVLPLVSQSIQHHSAHMQPPAKASDAQHAETEYFKYFKFNLCRSWHTSLGCMQRLLPAKLPTGGLSHHPPAQLYSQHSTSAPCYSSARCDLALRYLLRTGQGCAHTSANCLANLLQRCAADTRLSDGAWADLNCCDWCCACAASCRNKLCMGMPAAAAAVRLALSGSQELQGQAHFPPGGPVSNATPFTRLLSGCFCQS